MLKPGLSNMNSNYKELMTNIESEGRRKAIATLMKKHNITFEEAQHRQALRIIQSKARQK
jgi:hypothetical protein